MRCPRRGVVALLSMMPVLVVTALALRVRRVIVTVGALRATGYGPNPYGTRALGRGGTQICVSRAGGLPCLPS